MDYVKSIKSLLLIGFAFRVSRRKEEETITKPIIRAYLVNEINRR
jgi:hypothetical protein